MIEDALGLRVYQYKKEESLKKLEKTEENRAQVEALRKENGPHLRFLERQVKKLEKARELREQLVLMYHEYLKREENYLTLEREAIHGLREEPSLKLQAAEMRVAQIRKTLENAKGDDAARKDLLAAEASLSKLRTQEAEHLRTVGRIEGQVAFEEERIEDDKKRAGKEKGAPIPYRDVKAFWDELTRILDHGHSPAESADTLRAALTNAQKVVRKFVESHITHGQEYVPDTRSLERLQGEKTQAEAGIEQVRRLISEAEHHLEELRHTIESTKDESRELERELFERMAEQSKLHAQLAALDSREENLNRADAEFKREISEGIALIGRLVQGYKEYALPSEQGELDVLLDEERTAQEERRRALEKSKIRLEEMGGGSADEITKEYNETKERDDFLANELADLDRSAESLRSLIDELERELDQRFTSGVEEIGAQFNEFFNMMFGGGSASLKVVAQKKRRKLSSMLMGDDEVPDDEEGEDDTQPGIDIDVSLPKKRIQSLMMLSGGERALTSIALIFAMSQVNPPPFLILDETDAALDEANSRRYGDMITNLSKKSQLILITHNRETMSRSGVLYGITMGADGVSRILSVKFDDAVAVAK
jgi:chromosome segregation protein